MNVISPHSSEVPLGLGHYRLHSTAQRHGTHIHGPTNKYQKCSSRFYTVSSSCLSTLVISTNRTKPSSLKSETKTGNKLAVAWTAVRW
ncbi:hypothetical protein DL95DRAFT_7521 [Leptodontidium sp. 2 PMI_412]|nr:hypothetical protein DL95DRAFT_7521 [Leptodontidium sp. 2 PMI_412]